MKVHLLTAFGCLAACLLGAPSAAFAGSGQDLAVYPSVIHFNPTAPGDFRDEQRVYLSNTGEEMMVLSRWNVAGPHAPDYHPVLPTPLVLMPGEELEVVIHFMPEGRGERQAEWRLWTRNSSPPLKVRLLGSGGRALGLHLEAEVQGRGMIERKPDRVLYDEGEVVQLRAVPAPGWRFAGWRGATQGRLPETEIVMSVDRLSNRAIFEPIQPQRRALYRVNVNGSPLRDEYGWWRGDLPPRALPPGARLSECAPWSISAPAITIPASVLGDECGLVRDERPLRWRFRVRDNGRYQVVLYMRGRHAASGIGAEVAATRVSVQKSLVHANVNPPAGRVERLVFDAEVRNGAIDIVLLPIHGKPGLEAIEIWKIPAPSEGENLSGGVSN